MCDHAFWNLVQLPGLFGWYHEIYTRNLFNREKWRTGLLRAQGDRSIDGRRPAAEDIAGQIHAALLAHFTATGSVDRHELAGIPNGMPPKLWKMGRRAMGADSRGNWFHGVRGFACWARKCSRAPPPILLDRMRCQLPKRIVTPCTPTTLRLVHFEVSV
jgi:hypothetical protein